MTHEQQHVQIGASIGMYFHQGGELNVAMAMLHADEAMYEVKRHGRNAYQLALPTSS